MKKYLYFIIVLFYTNILYAQNELYINGHVSDSSKPTLFVKGNVGSVPTLFVKGEIINNQGVFQNDSSLIELTGNFTNTVGLGVSKYESTGIERFSGDSSQTISGVFNDTLTGYLNGDSSAINQLFQVEFAGDSTIILATNVNNHKYGSTTFTGDMIVLTGSNRYYIQNTDPSKLSGYGVSGDVTNFFQGELWREVKTGEAYDLPVGAAHSATSDFGEGVQMATVLVSSATKKGALQAKFENGSPSITPIIICPGAPTLEARDVDEILNNGFWTITNTENNISEYALTLNPADYTPLGTPGDYTIIQNGSPTGIDDCSGALTNLPITHAGLTTFSKFEIGASTDGAPLPVELINLEAIAIDNQYVNVLWQTATEINNDGFEIQRSEDGVDFETIGFVEGAGNSTDKLAYIYSDRDVQANILYYYRLKQIDFDGSFEFSSKVSASLNNMVNDVVVSQFIPNPSNANAVLNIQVNQASLAKIVMVNSLGQLMLNIDLQLSEGSNTLPFDLKNLSSGLYQTNVFIGDESFSRKLIISK